MKWKHTGSIRVDVCGNDSQLMARQDIQGIVLFALPYFNSIYTNKRKSIQILDIDSSPQEPSSLYTHHQRFQLRFCFLVYSS